MVHDLKDWVASDFVVCGGTSRFNLTSDKYDSKIEGAGLCRH